MFCRPCCSNRVTAPPRVQRNQISQAQTSSQDPQDFIENLFNSTNSSQSQIQRVCIPPPIKNKSRDGYGGLQFISAKHCAHPYTVHKTIKTYSRNRSSRTLQKSSFSNRTFGNWVRRERDKEDQETGKAQQHSILGTATERKNNVM